MKKDNKELFESIMKSVSTQVKKALNESSSDGWDEGELDFLTEILNQLYELKYEIESCRRGAYTNCETYEELAEHVHSLASALDDAAISLENMEGPFDDPEDDDFDDYEHD